MIFLEKRETGLKLIFMKDLLNVEKTCRKEKNILKIHERQAAEKNKNVEKFNFVFLDCI